MKSQKFLKNSIDLCFRIFRYNLKIIFSNKFIFFLTGAVLFFMIIVIANLFSDSNPSSGMVYYWLLFPGILIIFYPTTFGIQNDVDYQMIEIIFGIANYRYKVWLVRLIQIYVIVALILLLLSMMSYIAIVTFPIIEMVFHLMFPICFIGALAFMFSSMVRNGYGTAVLMIIIGLGFWIGSGILIRSKWNVFLNPFYLPSDINEAIWSGIILENRIYLAIGTIISVLWALFLLQKREKFI